MKKLGTSMRIALRALKVNRTRSALTMLGIIIGLPGSISSNGVRLGSGGVATLTTDDAKAIVDECPSVALTAPTVRGGVQVVYGSSNWATVVQGVTPDYMTLRDYTMMSGQFFTTQNVDASATVSYTH